MKPTIYYFTSTGNSQHIAKIIQTKLDSDLIPMRGNNGITCTSDIIGFVFPTYFWGIPQMVQAFIETINIPAKHPYIFAVTTCGQTSGGALGMVQEALANHHSTLSYGKTIRSVSNYIVEYDIKQNHIEKTLTTAKLHAEQAAEDILRKKRTSIRPPHFTDKLFYNIYQHRLSQDHHFIIEKTCTGCGLCQTICPAQNISLQDNKPTYHHHCQHCLACVHWCPQTAIQFKTKTQNRSRYHNPHIPPQELNH